MWPPGRDHVWQQRGRYGHRARFGRRQGQKWEPGRRRSARQSGCGRSCQPAGRRARRAAASAARMCAGQSFGLPRRMTFLYHPLCNRRRPAAADGSSRRYRHCRRRPGAANRALGRAGPEAQALVGHRTEGRDATGAGARALERGGRPMRVCEWCGASLEGRRSDARYCGGACRAADSRARRSDAHVSAHPPRLRTFAEDLALAQARALRAGVEVTIRLSPVAERDAALRDHIERTHRAEADDS
jgi:hypothetical protein